MNKSSVSLLQIILSGFDLLALNLMFFVVHGFFDRIPEALNTSYFKFSAAQSFMAFGKLGVWTVQR